MVNAYRRLITQELTKKYAEYETITIATMIEEILNAYLDGLTDGRDDGYDDGYKDGHEVGYDRGYYDGQHEIVETNRWKY